MGADYRSVGLASRDADRGPEVLPVLWVLIAISGVVVIARLWTKIRITHRLYYDDGLMLVALICGVIYASLMTVAVHYGFGRHYETLDPHQMSQSIHWGIMAVAWGILSPVAGRISFCITMLFLTGTDPRVKKWPIWIFIFLQAVINITQVALFFAQCGSNLDLFWSPADGRSFTQSCLNPAVQSYFGYAVGSFNCLTDAFLTLLPAILIDHTQLALKKKIGLGFLLCLSIVALAAAIIKTYSMRELSRISDYTYDLCIYVLWCAVELNVVIIVASIPLLRPIFSKRKAPHPQELPPQWDTTTFGSVFSKKAARSNHKKLSTSSEENIMQLEGEQYEMETTPGIVVTTEVSVTYQPSDAPFVHAALVGLLQGEIQNPKLAQR